MSDVPREPAVVAASEIHLAHRESVDIQVCNVLQFK